MAEPIDQNTIQTYDTYTIKIDNDRDHDIPLNAFYLVPYLKNDNNEKSKYSNSNIIPIKNKTYFTLGDLNFDVTINVEDHLMTADEFVNRVLFVKYPSIRDHEKITRLLSILPCTKAIYLGVLCILLNSGEYQDDGEDPILDRMQFLADLRDLKQIDVYNFVLDELLKMINNKNPINAEDYYPKIEYEQLNTPYDLSNTSIVSAGVEYQIGNNYNNIIKIKSNRFDLDQNAIASAKESFINIERIYASQIGENKPIVKSEIINTDDENVQARLLTITDFPSSILAVSNNVITNITQHCVITLPKGLTIYYPVYQNDAMSYRSSETVRKSYYSTELTEDINLVPGASIAITKIRAISIYGNIRILNLGNVVQQITIRQMPINWDSELTDDLNNKYLEKKTANTYVIKNIDNIRVLESNKDEHSVTNTSKSLKMVIPKGQKFLITGEKTVQILRSRIVKSIVTVAVTVFVTITSFIKNFWGVLTGKKTITEARTEYKQEVTERVEHWIESQISYLSKNYELADDITLLPGETKIIPTPDEDDAKTYTSKICFVNNTQVNIFKNYVADDQIQYSTDINITANIIDDPRTLADNIVIDSNTDNVTLSVPMEFTNSSENKRFELADGQITFRKENVNIANKYSNYTNILTKKKEKSTFTYILKKIGIALGINNQIDADSIVISDANVNDLPFKGDSSNRLYFEYVTNEDGQRVYGLAKTANGISQNSGVNVVTTYGRISESNNFGLTKKQKIEIQCNKIQFETLMRNYIIKQVRSLTENKNVIAGLEENVIYHINKINITPDLTVFLESNSLSKNNYENTMKDIDFLLDSRNSDIVFKIGNDYVIEYSGGITTSTDTDKSWNGGWVGLLVPNYNYSFTKIIKPVNVTSKYALDVSDMNLYYYNGIIYVK